MTHTATQTILIASPERARAAGDYGLPIGQLAYRIGNGPHLYRVQSPAIPRGGLMVVGDDNYDGEGDPQMFCQEVLRECTARGFEGIALDLEMRPTQTLSAIIERLSAHCARSGWSLYLPEAYSRYSDTALILISSAISGGALKERLSAAAERFGAERLVLCMARSAEDFYLPAPEGRGRPLSREELSARMRELSPSVFFSHELCAHYFTYMSRESGAHFVLFDDVGSIQQKMKLAESLGVVRFFLFYEQMDDLMPGLFPKRQR